MEPVLEQLGVVMPHAQRSSKYQVPKMRNGTPNVPSPLPHTPAAARRCYTAAASDDAAVAAAAALMATVSCGGLSSDPCCDTKADMPVHNCSACPGMMVSPGWLHAVRFCQLFFRGRVLQHRSRLLCCRLGILHDPAAEALDGVTICRSPSAARINLLPVRWVFTWSIAL